MLLLEYQELSGKMIEWRLFEGVLCRGVQQSLPSWSILILSQRTLKTVLHQFSGKKQTRSCFEGRRTNSHRVTSTWGPPTYLVLHPYVQRTTRHVLNT